jgi:hypothetical protein
MRIDPFFVLGDLFEDRLGGRIVVPETRLGGFVFKLSYFCLTGVEVKDTSLTCRGGSSVQATSFSVPQSSSSPPQGFEK